MPGVPSVACTVILACPSATAVTVLAQTGPLGTVAAVALEEFHVGALVASQTKLLQLVALSEAVNPC